MPKRVTTVFSGVPGAPYYANHFFADLDTAANVVSAIDGFWDSLSAIIANDLAWTVQGDVAIIDLATGEITGVDSVTGANGAGAATGSIIPLASQGLIQWFTNAYLGGRRIRGRTFVPCLTAPAVLDGEVTAAAQTSMANAGDALIAHPTTNLGIYSRTHHAFAPVTDAVAWNQFAQLRSRRD